MKIIILSILVFLFVILIKNRVEGFTNPSDCLSSANKHLILELSESKDPEKRQKIVNAINYIDFIKTIIN